MKDCIDHSGITNNIIWKCNKISQYCSSLTGQWTIPVEQILLTMEQVSGGRIFSLLQTMCYECFRMQSLEQKLWVQGKTYKPYTTKKIQYCSCNSGSIWYSLAELNILAWNAHEHSSCLGNKAVRCVTTKFLWMKKNQIGLH